MRKNFYSKHKNKKIISCFLLLLIVILIFVYYYKITVPFVNEMAEETIKSEAIYCINQSNDYIQKMSAFYDELFEFVKNNDGDIVLIKSNSALINQINMLASTKVQDYLNQMKTKEISIPAGSFTGSAVFAEIGTKIPLKITSIGNCNTNFRSEFFSVGINQTIHRLTVDVDVVIAILAPWRSSDVEVSYEILITENVIVGKVPETYISSDNLDTNYLDLLPE